MHSGPLMRLSLFLCILLTASANAQNIAEQYLLQQVNQHRAEQRLAPLAWDATLARAARAHALLIARSPGPAEHQYPGEPDLLTRAAQAGAHFSTISENVAGNAQSAPQLDTSWMNSPHHRANILNPQLTAIGIAVVQSRGLLYAVQDFARNVANFSPNDAEARAQQLLQTHGLQPETSSQAHADARHACSQSSQSLNQPVPSSPQLVVQWEGSDLNQLPAAVLNSAQQAPTKPQAAAVATCTPTRQNPGFTTYRLAVLLY